MHVDGCARMLMYVDGYGYVDPCGWRSTNVDACEMLWMDVDAC